MISFPNCKINLGLNIIRKRADGYHDLETVFYPVKINDALEIVRDETTTMTITGIPIQGNMDDNLCMKAYRLLLQDFPEIPSIKIHLHKAIPMGAGLGGGSADGAFMLLLLNKKFNLQLSQQQLINYALQLGSDCPFFIINQPAFATSRGEQLNEVQLDLSAYKLVLVNPGIHVSTKEAFAYLSPVVPAIKCSKIISQPIETWKDKLVNDFEKPVFAQHPEIGAIKNALYQQGAVYASMTGSGSTVYGFFKEEVPSFSFPSSYYIVVV